VWEKERSRVREFEGSAVPRATREETSAVTIERFEDLKSWQEARKLMQVVYRLTRGKAFAQDHGLGWQMEAAAVSAMGNMACPVK
jgi:hypothetical protein